MINEQQLDRAVEENTKERVDKMFTKMLNIIKYGPDSNEFILLEAKQELDIFKVADEFGVLHKLNDWEAQHNHVHIKCPFHQDNNPSCSIWREIGAYKCWSCGEKGDIIRFVQLLSGSSNVPYGLLRRLLKKENLLKNK